MNKRIEELAEEAAKYSAIMFLPTGENGNKLFVDKFAELIVRECASYIEDRFCLDGEEIYVANKLKEHFGVEE